MNKLATESSPYLLQHASNPVHWQAYSAEIFTLAKQQDTLIFLSIGYSSCHWCHVMARESFEDPDTAEFMNKHFICIKMDREEHPGVDKIYQDIYQLLHGRGGGWPLSVWLTPDARPIYIGTYFPNVTRYNIPSFMDVNKKLVKLWQFERVAVEQQAASIASGINLLNTDILSSEPSLLTQQIFHDTVTVLQRQFDHRYGGIGSAPKFPHISTLRFLLQESYETQNHQLLDFVHFTFKKMMWGGIYDQLGGGFARYSVDAQWLIPHFEKMLYDNAGFLQVGAEIFALTQDVAIKSVLLHTFNWLLHELQDVQGAFYATLNAESEGREGKFYVWTIKELRAVLSETEFIDATTYYGITKNGNFMDPHHPEIKGLNVLHVVDTTPPKTLNSINSKLLAHRNKRIKPDLDNKIITSWNAQLVSALFTFASHCNVPAAGETAIRTLTYLLDIHVKTDHVIRYSTSSQFREIEGTLDDYAYLIEALIDAFEFTDIWHYMRSAQHIQNLLQQKFYADDIYYDTSSEITSLGRKIKFTDDSFSAGISIQLRNLYRLSKYFENPKYLKIGELIISKLAKQATQYPTAMSEFLLATNYYLRSPTELVLVGKGNLNKDLLAPYYPAKLVYRWDNNTDERPQWEILENRLTEDLPTLFICKGNTCLLPITTPDQYSAVTAHKRV